MVFTLTISPNIDKTEKRKKEKDYNDKIKLGNCIIDSEYNLKSTFNYLKAKPYWIIATRCKITKQKQAIINVIQMG